MKLLSHCLVCSASLGEAMLHIPGPAAVTSLGEIVAAETIVYQCTHCSHVQTAPLDNVLEYYSSGYNIRNDSEDEDDLYELVDGEPVYRSQHQSTVVLQTHQQLAPSARVLDYGCAKASSLRYILRSRPDLDGFVFDISNAYKSHWDDFIKPENQSSFTPNCAWTGLFDLVLSFFALEHTERPVEFINNLEALVKPGGVVHLVFPNMYHNYGDMIVVDHVNHFSERSILDLFSKTSLTVKEISTSKHRAAFVVVAIKGVYKTSIISSGNDASLAISGAKAIAEFWQRSFDRISLFEESLPCDSAIYGSGVYGMFILSNLKRPDRVRYFLDQNPHQQGKVFQNKPVISPTSVGDDVNVIYVGLNPEVARKVISGSERINTLPRQYFYL